MRGGVVLASLLLVLAGCGAIEPTGSAEPSPSTDGDGGADGEVCQPIDLRMPTGGPVDLTGQWRVNQNWDEVFITQQGSCVYWMARSVWSDDVPPGSASGSVFFGKVASDFTVAGSWADVPIVTGAPLSRGGFRFEVKFFVYNGTTWPALHELNPRPEGPKYSGWVFVPEGTLSERTEFVGTYGFDAPDCDWLEVDGKRYALVQNAWLVEGDPAAVRVAAGQVIGAEGAVGGSGDRLRVDGRIAPDLFRPGCQSSAIMAWEIQPSPLP